jgi:hypothetical protein
MSTLQTTPQHRNRTSTRLGGKVLLLSALVASGLALLVLAPTNHHAIAPTSSSTAHEAAITTQTQAPVGCFRDPATHALTCSHTAPSPVATPAPAGYFRDPTTHQLLRLAGAPNRAKQHPANHPRGRIIP